MGMGYEQKIQLPPVLFLGLDTESNEVFGQGGGSPYIRNMDLRPVGGMRKRPGQLRAMAGDSVLVVPGDGEISDIFALQRQEAGAAHLWINREGAVSRYDLDLNNPAELAVRMSAKTGTSVVGMFSENDPSATNYLGECAYYANGEVEPVIATAEDVDTWEDSVANASVTGGSGNPVLVTLSSAPSVRPLQNGDWVKISGSSGILGGEVAANPWRIELVSATTFYLLDDDGSRHIFASVGSVVSPGTTEIAPKALRRWPKLNYSGTASEQRTGYPDRWEDPEAAGGSGWPVGADPDWPSGISLVSEGDSQRMFAYGFDKDPDRIDYSQIGVPWHFGKQDMTGSATAAGVDGGFLYVKRGDGDRVVAVREFLGYTVVFKKKRTFIYQGSPGDNWQLVRTIDTGAVSERGIVEYGNDLLYWSLDGPRSLSATEQYGDISTSRLAFMCNDEVVKVTPSALAKIHAYHDTEGERIVWMVPFNGSTDVSAAFVFYPGTPSAPPRWSIWAGAFCETPAVAEVGPIIGADRIIYAAGTDGFLYVANSGTHDGVTGFQFAYDSGIGTVPVNGEVIQWGVATPGRGTVLTSVGDGVSGYIAVHWDSGPPPEDGDTFTGLSSTAVASVDGVVTERVEVITAEYITRWMDLGGIDWSKRALHANIIYGDQGVARSKLYFAWDYRSGWGETWDAVRIRGAEGAYWGSMVWGSFTWGETGRSMRRYAFRDMGSLLRLRFYDDSRYGFQIHGLTLDVRVKGDRG